MDFGDAVRLLLVLFNSTVKINLSVGLPFDLHVYANDALNSDGQIRIEVDDKTYHAISSDWGDALKAALERLPDNKV